MEKQQQQQQQQNNNNNGKGNNNIHIILQCLRIFPHEQIIWH